MDNLLSHLETYRVSREDGFVPDKGSRPLPVYYKSWEDLASALPTRLKDNNLGDALTSLPLLVVDHFRKAGDWQRAYIVLAFVIHGYVHGCRKTTVPISLSQPFLKVCDHLGVKPVLSYAGLCLYNWSPGGRKDVLQGLQTQFSFTGTLDEAAFYIVPVLVERAGGRLPAFMLKALIAARDGRWDAVAGYLYVCRDSIRRMAEALGQLSLCQPSAFYRRIRPYIAGLEVEFERIDEVPLVVKVAGGSAAQSSLFQFLDHVLAVEHVSPLLDEMRAYMPSGHRQFLQEVFKLPSLPELAKAGAAPEEVAAKLRECQIELKTWRDKHIAIVTRYILLPAQAAARNEDPGAVKVLGTAGSSPLKFLKDVRNDTILAAGA